MEEAIEEIIDDIAKRIDELSGVGGSEDVFAIEQLEWVKSALEDVV